MLIFDCLYCHEREPRYAVQGLPAMPHQETKGKIRKIKPVVTAPKE
jgi:hypothetical protein